MSGFTSPLYRVITNVSHILVLNDVLKSVTHDLDWLSQQPRKLFWDQRPTMPSASVKQNTELFNECAINDGHCIAYHK